MFSMVGSSCRKLVERRNREERFAGLRPFPIGEELVPVQVEPLEHEGLCATRELTVDTPVANGNGDLGVAVARVEVRGRVIAVVDRDGNAEKARDDGHCSKYRDGCCCITPEVQLRSACSPGARDWNA